ncbi:MAG: ADP-ribose pyrophosphatase [Phycisphaerae bacterium]|nr:ADP-ribose pyrophosphatase [Phycisphaerae bacterium]
MADRPDATDVTMPEVIDRRRLHDGPRISLDRLTVRAGDGQIVRDVVRHPGAVVILPLTGDSRVILIRNARVAIGCVLLELPAGTLEPPEEPRACAARELTEETGYSAGRLERLCGFYSAPGFCDEYLHVFVAENLSAGAMDPDAGESLAPVAVELDEAVRMCLDGRIEDGKTIAVLLAYRCMSGQGGSA